MAINIRKQRWLGGWGLSALAVVLVIIGSCTTTTPVPEVDDSPTPGPSSSAPADAFREGAESGKSLRAAGREFDDEFVQEAMSRAESSIFGSSGKWTVSNSDLFAVCDFIYRIGDAIANGVNVDIEDAITDQLDSKDATLYGVIAGGAASDSASFAEFCLPFFAYGVGFNGAYEFNEEAFGIDPSVSDVSAKIDSAIDVLPRSKLRTDAETAFGLGFAAGGNAALEIHRDRGPNSSTDPQMPDIRFVGASDLSDANKSTLAELIESIQEGVVQITAGTGSGSGFIVNGSGLVVTNEHVVAGENKVNIRLAGGRRYDGDVLERDSTADLALVKIIGDGTFHAIAVANPGGTRVGDEVLALGFPVADRIGSNLTVTRGIISSIRTADGVQLFQTDAAINPGNSGGPLVNRRGEVIGVSTFRIEQTGSGRPVESIGFAVSVVEIARMANLTYAPPTVSAESTPPKPMNTPTPASASGPIPKPETTLVPLADAFVSVGAGFSHTCGVKLDGTVVCWGSTRADAFGNYPGRADPPSGPFVSVAAGDYHTCGIKMDRSVECWGWDTFERSTPPSGLFTSISVGAGHSCGVRQDKSVECWGSPLLGKSDPPAGSFASVSAGVLGTCGIRTDGFIECWGDTRDRIPPGSFVDVAVGYSHACAIRTDGSVQCWGSNSDGQATAPAGTFATVSAGAHHTCGLKKDGSAECWGNDFEGRTTPPAGTFSSISAGWNHTCGLKSQGSVVCWGSDSSGQSTPPQFGN